MRVPGAGFKAGCGRAASVMRCAMSAWKYLSNGFWQRVPLPLLGRVPLNAAALAGFAVAGFDNPVLWAAGAAWQTLWLTATAGRTGYRRGIDAAERRAAWRTVEERRLQLYNQLPDADRLRHHQLRAACQRLISPAPGAEPHAAAELFTWLHLKLLLARHQILTHQPLTPDADAPRLQAGAAVELTDPVRARLADETIGLLDPRLGLHDPNAPRLPAIEAALQRIEAELALLSGTARVAPVDFTALARAADAEAAALTAPTPVTAPDQSNRTTAAEVSAAAAQMEVDTMIHRLAE